MEKFDENDGRWVTLDNGQKVFIRKGESFKDAYRRRTQNTTNERGKGAIRKILEKKQLENEYKKTQEEYDKLYNKIYKGEGKEIDHEGRKIKVRNSQGNATEDEEDRLVTLADKLDDLEFKIKKLK